MNLAVRHEVMERIIDVIRNAEEQGDERGVDAARRAFPGTPESVFWEAWAVHDWRKTEAWWDVVERTIEGEVIDRAIAATAQLKGASS